MLPPFGVKADFGPGFPSSMHRTIGCHGITETNKINLVLSWFYLKLGLILKHSRTFASYFAAIDRILISVP
jgi:hypothetical protein